MISYAPIKWLKKVNKWIISLFEDKIRGADRFY